MKENLNVGEMISSQTDQTDNGIIEKYCYEDNQENCNIYGGLYKWDELMDYVDEEGVRGICPEGWHVPTDDEWKVLEGIADSQYDVGDPEWNNMGWNGFDVGKNLKSTYGWDSNGNGTDMINFTGLPAGEYSVYGYFQHDSIAGYWWTSTHHDYGCGDNTRVYRTLNRFYDLIDREEIDPDFGYSVRCIKDD